MLPCWPGFTSHPLNNTSHSLDESCDHFNHRQLSVPETPSVNIEGCSFVTASLWCVQSGSTVTCVYYIILYYISHSPQTCWPPSHMAGWSGSEPQVSPDTLCEASAALRSDLFTHTRSSKVTMRRTEPSWTFIIIIVKWLTILHSYLTQFITEKWNWNVYWIMYFF